MGWDIAQQALKTTLREMGQGEVKPLGERLLFRDRCFVGVCFEFEHLTAVWLPAISQLKFLDDSGRLLLVLSLTAAEQESDRNAA